MTTEYEELWVKTSCRWLIRNLPHLHSRIEPDFDRYGGHVANDAACITEAGHAQNTITGRLNVAIMGLAVEVLRREINHTLRPYGFRQIDVGCPAIDVDPQVRRG